MSLLSYTLGILTGSSLTTAAAFFAYRTAQWHSHDHRQPPPGGAR